MGDVSALREIALGVRDVPDRLHFLREAFGLSAERSGFVDPGSAKALWGLDRPLEAAVVGRADAPDGPRLRLVAASGAPARADGRLSSPGPIGFGVTTRDIQAVHARVASLGVRFLSPPVRLTPGSVGPTGPVRWETFGQAPDGELVVLIERINAPQPYGVISDEGATSAPLHASFVVGDLDACSRFMRELLLHETVIRDRGEGEVFDQVLGTPPGTRFRFEMLQRPGAAAGRIIFIEFERREDEMPETAPETAPPARGVQALRYDVGDLDEVLARASAAGGRLVRGPLAVRSELLGSGRVACVSPPFGTLVELWQPA